MAEAREGGKQGFLEAFEDLEDPRSRECVHRFDELLLAALCAITSGADSWISVVNWSAMKLGWLQRFLPFANGIASHDTFSRVFNLLDANRFEACWLCRNKAVRIEGWFHCTYSLRRQPSVRF